MNIAAAVIETLFIKRLTEDVEAGRVNILCDNCGGTRTIKDSGCPSCKTLQKKVLSVDPITITCPSCHCTRSIDDKPCELCGAERRDA